MAPEAGPRACLERRDHLHDGPPVRARAHAEGLVHPSLPPASRRPRGRFV